MCTCALKTQDYMYTRRHLAALQFSAVCSRVSVLEDLLRRYVYVGDAAKSFSVFLRECTVAIDASP